ncbi:MAG: LuxR C-terminal-related transcriptional regulator [Armatimonadota bacterium]|jgi:two-component system response regulator DevR
MSVGTIKVLIVDDYALVRQGLINILKQEPDIEVVGEAADLDQCLRLCRSESPHVVLLDTSLGDTNVVTAIRLINTQFPGVRIVAVADQSERNCSVLRGTSQCRHRGSSDPSDPADCVVQAIRAGARGAIRLSDTTAELVNAVRAVRDGRYWVDGPATARVMEALFNSRDTSSDLIPQAGLTEREELICRMIADGLSNKEIASRLNIAQQTVKNHVSSILRKSGLEDRLQVARAVLLRTGCPARSASDN